VRFILLTLLVLLGLAVPTARSQLPRCDAACAAVASAEWTAEEHDDGRAETPVVPARASSSAARSTHPTRVASGGSGLLGEDVHRWTAFEVAGRGTASDRRDPVARACRRQPGSRGPPEEPSAA